MKTLIGCLWIATAALGQLNSQSRPLGGAGGVSPVISRPLGGVALPTFPGAPAKKTGTRTGGASRYVGPIYYIPTVSDYVPSDTAYGYQPPAPPPAQPQPIIINQYFDTRRPAPSTEDNPAPAADLKPGDPLAEPENYYLIEYKDHTIYSALAYWVEGDTLHYVTTRNTHNQASLNLIDLDKTYKLNQDRSVPFAIAGK